MKRIKLTVAYDGTNYCGWQVQDNGITVEAVLNRHLSELLGEPIRVTGASRTDSGVHAMGNVAVFDTMTRIPPEKISYALNTRLPEDIRIQHSCEVAADFHPRRCVSRKTYEYRILNRTFELPTERLYSYFVHRPLNEQNMQKAAEFLVGEHDFKSFCSAGSQVESTVRTIYSLDVKREGDLIRVCVTGNGFLYNMVRIIVGTLLSVGYGMYPPVHVKEILEARDRGQAGPKAPAWGLFLKEIYFENNI
jgi:tRNA pseudouridine38-40 synthase